MLGAQLKIYEVTKSEKWKLRYSKDAESFVVGFPSILLAQMQQNTVPSVVDTGGTSRTIFNGTATYYYSCTQTMEATMLHTA